jgi:hypothetical protein
MFKFPAEKKRRSIPPPDAGQPWNSVVALVTEGNCGWCVVDRDGSWRYWELEDDIRYWECEDDFYSVNCLVQNILVNRRQNWILVNCRQNWKSWERRGENLDYQVIIKLFRAWLSNPLIIRPGRGWDLTLIITISDTSENQPKGSDSDNQINISTNQHINHDTKPCPLLYIYFANRARQFLGLDAHLQDRHVSISHLSGPV